VHPLPKVPLWRTPITGALVAIVLLIAAVIGSAIWLSVVNDRRIAQEQLVRQAHHVALQIRGRMVETEQLLLLEGFSYAGSERRFEADMLELMQANQALLRVELRARDGRLLQAVNPPAPRGSLPDQLRRELSVEAAAALENAAGVNRLTYSRPYFVQVAETGFDLFELMVPTGEETGPIIVAVYSPQRILDHFIPIELPPDQLYSLTESDGTVVARQPSMGQPQGPQFATSPLARAGNSLHLRVDSLRFESRLIPNLLTGLVALTSIALGLAVFFLVRDVTSRAAAERALREQIGFRRAIEDAMVDALAVQDMDGRLVHVNAALCRITGYSEAELIGKRRPPFSTGKSVRDYAASRRARDVGDSDARSFQTVFKRRTGERFPAMVSETPMFDSAGQQTGWLLLGSDLTEQQQVEELARRQQEVLQSRSRLATLGEMASTLSHELNQPLAAITSYAAACENLMAAAPQRPDSIRQALRGIKAQAERAGQVIRSVHAFLKRRQIERAECSIATLVHGLEPLIRLQAARTGAGVEVAIDPDTTVHADRIMLEQVMLNLTRNGFEAMSDVPPRDRVLEVLARRVSQDERGDRVEVSVIDRGRGVPQDVVPQLFSAFFTTKTEGMGLGLSLCRSVIEQHGGQMIYRPRPGGGSIFSFDLPIQASEGNGVAPADEEEETRNE
jgi:two-component system, LuxR family, sensor histidine kinase DctS